MTDISKEAVERHIERIGPAPGPREGYHASLNYDTITMLRSLSARVEELEGDREQFALAIMGGEDAPGFAAAQLTETLVQLIADNRKDAIAWAEYDAKEAEKRGRLQGLDEAIEFLRCRPQTPQMIALIESINALKEQSQ